MIKHEFDFVSSQHGIIETIEPVGFDSAEFEIAQDDNRKGRDVTSAGANNQKLQIWNIPEYPFQTFLYNLDTYGFEAEILYRLTIDEEEFIIGQCTDFVTDRVNYIEFAVIETQDKALLKSRYEAKTNLLSDKDLNGDPITPVTLVPVLMKAKPVVGISEWSTPIGNNTGSIVAGLGGEGNNIFKSFGFANLTERSDIRATLSYIQGLGQPERFGYIEAQDNMRDITIRITSLSFVINGFGNGYSNIRLKWFVGNDEDLDTGFEGITITSSNDILNGDATWSETNSSYEIYIPSMDRGQKLYIYFVSLTASSSNLDTYAVSINVLSMDVQITATSIAYNSIVEMVRLIDAMRYNVKSSTGLDIQAERWDFGGELYDNFITTQSLMRGLTERAFNISTKDIVEDHVQSEVNGDYQLQEDDLIYFGGADNEVDDFYKPYEIGSYSQKDLTDEFGQPKGQITGYKEEFNPRFFVNMFNFGFKYYESQKEIEQANTNDEVHADSEWLLQNRNGNNKKEAKVGLIRSASSWEQARRKAIDLTDSAATQDDDKIYIVDVVELQQSDRFITETTLLQHEVMDDNHLVLKNDGSLSWELMGISVGTSFTITSEVNQGAYIVTQVSEQQLILFTSFPIEDDLEANTTYTYFIAPWVAMYTNRTNEGFDVIENIAEGNNYSNLAYTVKRVILKRYNSYLATCNLYRPTDVVTNTLYKNNPDATTKLQTEDEAVVEAESFVPYNPILTPKLIDVSIVMTMTEFLRLRRLQREENGFIRTFYADGLPLKGFIKKGIWKPDNRTDKHGNSRLNLVGVMTASLEEKYEPFYMSIIGEQRNSIIINGEIAPNNFDFQIKSDNKLYIHDETGKLIFTPIPYDRVQVNNSEKASSPFELIQWLNLLIVRD